MLDWRQLYAASIVETNAEHLDLLIDETLRAIGSRLDELLKQGQTENSETKIEDLDYPGYAPRDAGKST